MSENTADKKPDLSNFPRGAISIKGLPVSRNARLPSIRIPRDLTLGAQPKRTFKPNIPVRREKRATEQKKDSDQSDAASHSAKHDSKHTLSKGDRGRGRGRGRGRELIQMEGALFEQGIAAIPKDRSKEPGFSRSGFSSARATSGRKMKADSRMENMDQDMDALLRDDFIDDGSDEDDLKGAGPVIFPIQEKDKNEAEQKIKKEKIDKDFNDENFAKDMGFDVKKISKFIKKEKRDDEVAVHPTKEAISNLPKNDVTDLFKTEDQLFLIKFPQCFTTRLQDHQSTKCPPRAENVSSNEKETNTSISGLPEGRLGKIQILKSGQARLVVGSLNFQLDYVKNLSTKHELVSVNTDACDISVLANVKHLLNISPDIVGSLTSLKLDR